MGINTEVDYMSWTETDLSTGRSVTLKLAYDVLLGKSIVEYSFNSGESGELSYAGPVRNLGIPALQNLAQDLLRTYGQRQPYQDSKSILL